MEHRFGYGIDGRRLCWSILFFVVVIALIVLLELFVANTYLSAWLLGVVFALCLLAVVSIPVYVKINKVNFEIRCVLEMTVIPMEDIVSVRRIDRSELKPLIPIFASCGFAGHYGYYLNLKNWTLYKVYASAWEDLVLVEDIYEDCYLVNSKDADQLVEQTMMMRNCRRKEIIEYQTEAAR